MATELWEGVPLGDVMSLDVQTVPVQDDETYEMAGVFSFARGLFVREALPGRETSYKRLHRLQEGQLVLSRLKGWEGALALVSPEFAGRHLSTEFPTFRVDPDRALPEFLWLVMQRPAFWERLKDLSSGMGGRKERVKADGLLSVEVLIPSLSVQRRIVDLIDHIDHALAAEQRLAERTHGAEVQTVRSALATASGSRQRLADCLAVSIGGVWGSSPGGAEVEVRVIRSTDFADLESRSSDVGVQRSVTERQLQSRGLRRGDVLIEKSGGGPKSPVGRVTLVRSQPQLPTVSANFVQLVRAEPTQLNPTFLYHLLNSWHVSGRTLEFQRRTTGIRNLKTKDYLVQEVELPSIQDQARLADVFESVRNASDATENLVARTQEFRSAVLHSLLSGDHEIPESYDRFLEQGAA